MAFVRCYTGTDGQSHFEDLTCSHLTWESASEQAAAASTFTRFANGRFSAIGTMRPRRQYAIFLSGERWRS